MGHETLSGWWCRKANFLLFLSSSLLARMQMGLLKPRVAILDHDTETAIWNLWSNKKQGILMIKEMPEDLHMRNKILICLSHYYLDFSVTCTKTTPMTSYIISLWNNIVVFTQEKMSIRVKVIKEALLFNSVKQSPLLIIFSPLFIKEIF